VKRLCLGMLILLTACFSAACDEEEKIGPDLKKSLVAATAKALEMEIRDYQVKLKSARDGVGPKENVEKFKARLAELEKDLARFKSMDPAAYPNPRIADKAGPDALEAKYGPVLPPRKIYVGVTVDAPYYNGSLLDLDGATKSGPFYHLAGIEGDCPCVLKTGKHYRLGVYLLYRREYFGFIQDYYVYVAEIGE
jgi:hypothetical protein